MKKIGSFLLQSFKALTFLGFFLITVLVGFAYYKYEKFSSVVEGIKTMQLPQTTEIFDRNGRKIANVLKKEHRFYVHFDELPEIMVAMLLAVEDTTFFEHQGVNIDAVFRAAIKNLKAGHLVEGASTLTQQVAKNFFLNFDKKLVRKFDELLIALKLERTLSKEKILELYLNKIFFGHGYYGVKTAARGYFNKELNELTLKEIAMLMAIPKSPTRYNPTKNYKLSLGRSNRIVTRLRELGWIDKISYENALKEEPVVYSNTLTRNQAPYLVDTVLNELKDKLPDLKIGGYKIYTTFDLQMQAIAKDAMQQALKGTIERNEKMYKNFNISEFDQFNGAFVAINQHTGEVLSLVGGLDYKKSSFNRAMNARRQPGSAFKPFVYSVALNNGYSVLSQVADVARRYEFEQDENKTFVWTPKNSSSSFAGLISLQEALVRSRNLATINLSMELGAQKLVKGLQKFGFEVNRTSFNLSMVLGSLAMSPFALSQAYTSITNYGVQSKLFFVKKVKKGQRIVLENNSSFTPILEPSQAFLTLSMMKDVIKRGTGRVKLKNIEFAGKTGTTNESKDTWFVGVSPEVQTITWFGKDNYKPMREKEYGSNVAGPATKYFFQNLIKINPKIRRSFKSYKEFKGVSRRIIGGKPYFFTDKSPLPKTIKQDARAAEDIIF